MYRYAHVDTAWVQAGKDIAVISPYSMYTGTLYMYCSTHLTFTYASPAKIAKSAHLHYTYMYILDYTIIWESVPEGQQLPNYYLLYAPCHPKS